MSKNKKLLLNKDARAFKGEERALSDSSAEIYANCPAYFAYTYKLFAHRGAVAKFIWFIYGSVIHKVADAIRTEVLVEKKVANDLQGDELKSYLSKWYYQVKLALDPTLAQRTTGKSEPFLWIPQETIDKMGAKRYFQLVEKKREDYLQKAWNTISAVYMSTRVPTGFTFNKYEWRFSSQRFRIPNYHVPEKPIWILGAFDEINYMQDGSDLWYIVTDLKSGNKNNLKTQNNHQMLVYNYLTRNLDHTAPLSKEGERFDHLKDFNGLAPREQYLVSLDIDPWAIEKHKEKVLYSDDFRLLVEVNFEEEWPEHNKFLSDVWREQVAMLKEHDQSGNLYAEEFEPLSMRGRQIGIGKSIRESRFVPKISPRCGLCAARPWCKEDHPDDWDIYRERHNLGLKDDAEHFILEQVTDVVDDHQEIPVETISVSQNVLDFSLGKASKHISLVSSLVPKRRLKEMQQLGFMQAKSLVALFKKAIRALPLLKSGKCQCQGFKDLIYMDLVALTMLFHQEVQENTIIAEEELAKRRYKPKSKPVISPNPETMHRFMIEHCPLEDCLRRKECLAEEGGAKDAA
jgi:hypothetical protein